MKFAKISGSVNTFSDISFIMISSINTSSHFEFCKSVGSFAIVYIISFSAVNLVGLVISTSVTLNWLKKKIDESCITY